MCCRQRFAQPNGVAVDGSGNVYVADTNNDGVRTVASDGTTGTLVGAAGISGYFDGVRTDALFNLPHGLNVAVTSGNIYIADTANNLIRKSTPAGSVITVSGQAGIAGLRNSAAGLPLYSQPQAVVADTAENLYVADTGNSVIRKISQDGTVTTLALSAGGSSGSSSGSGSGGGSGGGSFSTIFSGLLALLTGLRLYARRK